MMRRLSCLAEILLLIGIVSCVVVESYRAPAEAYPDGLRWFYRGGVSDFGVMVAPSIENHWYYVHCEVKDYWLGMRPGAEYRYNENNNYYEPLEEGLSACEYMSERYRVRMFLPLVQNDN